MKTKFILLFALLIASCSYAQNRFSVGVTQDLTSSFQNTDTARRVGSFSNSGTSIRFGYQFDNGDAGKLELYTSYHILAQSNDYTNISDNSMETAPEYFNRPNSGQYMIYNYRLKTGTYYYRAFSFGVNLFKDVSKYFGVGAGVKIDFIQSSTSDSRYIASYLWSQPNNRYEHYQTTGPITGFVETNIAQLMVPIVLKGYIPLKDKKRIALNYSANFHYRFLQHQLTLGFEF
jgi:hypothetical protein